MSSVKRKNEARTLLQAPCRSISHDQWPRYTYAEAIGCRERAERPRQKRWAREPLSYYLSLNVLTVCHLQSLIIDINWRVFKAHKGEQEQEKESWEEGEKESETQWSVRGVLKRFLARIPAQGKGGKKKRWGGGKTSKSELRLILRVMVQPYWRRQITYVWPLLGEKEGLGFWASPGEWRRSWLAVLLKRSLLSTLKD